MGNSVGTVPGRQMWARWTYLPHRDSGEVAPGPEGKENVASVSFSDGEKVSYCVLLEQAPPCTAHLCI